MDSDEIAAKYIRLEMCTGYCKDAVMRKVAIICAFDSVTTKGRAGSDIFPEFSKDAIRMKSPISSGRGITISEGV